MKRYLVILLVVLLAIPSYTVAVESVTFEETVLGPMYPLEFYYNCETNSMLKGEFTVSSIFNLATVDFVILDARNHSLWYRQRHYGEDLHLSVLADYNKSEIKGFETWRYSIPEEGLYWIQFRSESTAFVEGTIEYLNATEASELQRSETISTITTIIILVPLVLVLGYVIRGRFKPKKQTRYTQPPPHQPAQNRMKTFCPYCGNPRVLLDARFCSSCGASYGEGAAVE